MARPTTSLDYYATLARAPHHDDDALTGGAWVGDRGVMRWVEYEVPAPVVIDLQDLIVCPTCHAHADELCKTRTGRHRTPHSTRFVDKRCSCGGRLMAGKKVCQDCRAQARRDRARASMRRSRARRRQQNLGSSVDERFCLSVVERTMNNKDTTHGSALELGAGTPLEGLAGRAKDTTD